MLDEIIVTLEQGAWKPFPIIKRSGTKATVKIQAPIATLLNSVRSQDIDPEKGTKNKPHIHVRVPSKLIR